MTGCKRKTQSASVKDFYALIGKKLISDLVSEGIINERFVRDLSIREEYENLIATGIKSKDARKMLSEKLFTPFNGDKFCLGEKNIEKIIYLNNPIKH